MTKHLLQQQHKTPGPSDISEIRHCSIVWFRLDLRVTDHQPLTIACQRGEPVVAIYVYDNHLFRHTSHYHFPNTSVHRLTFIKQSVENVQTHLLTMGIPIYIGLGDTAEEFVKLKKCLLAHQFQANHIFYGYEDGQIEQDIVRNCIDHPELQDWQWHAFRNGDLFAEHQHPPLAQCPQLFTNFRVTMEQGNYPPSPLPIPPYSQSLSAHLIPFIHPLQQHPQLSPLYRENSENKSTECMIWQGGSDAGRKRLDDYLFVTDFVSRYKITRNGLQSPNDSSRLSAWLAQGCISPREVYRELKRYEQLRIRNESTYWLFFELVWREFFRLQHRKWGNRLFQRMGIQRRHKEWQSDEGKIEAWLTGKTGYPLVDASMRELVATGYTSNRARQNAASFLTQTWHIDWLLGAEWYESQLIDYDSASNYGNWQYLAGVGNDARKDRVFDVDKQAKLYDPDGKYVHYWLHNKN